MIETNKIFKSLDQISHLVDLSSNTLFYYCYYLLAYQNNQTEIACKATNRILHAASSLIQTI